MDTLSRYKILTITHKSTSLKNIGNFVLPNLDSECALQEKLETIQAALGMDELLYLATCNRVLFFFSSMQALTDSFLEKFESVVYPNLEATIKLKDSASAYSGKAAITHLLEVASSVDSLVIGEREIFTTIERSLSTLQRSRSNRRFYSYGGSIGRRIC